MRISQLLMWFCTEAGFGETLGHFNYSERFERKEKENSTKLINFICDSFRQWKWKVVIRVNHCNYCHSNANIDKVKIRNISISKCLMSWNLFTILLAVLSIFPTENLPPVGTMTHSYPSTKWFRTWGAKWLLSEERILCA